jgi:hypothetical protein
VNFQRALCRVGGSGESAAAKGRGAHPLKALRLFLQPQRLDHAPLDTCGVGCFVCDSVTGLMPFALSAGKGGNTSQDAAPSTAKGRTGEPAVNNCDSEGRREKGDWRSPCGS